MFSLSSRLKLGIFDRNCSSKVTVLVIKPTRRITCLTTVTLVKRSLSVPQQKVRRSKSSGLEIDIGCAPKSRTSLVSLSKAQRAGLAITPDDGSTRMCATYKGSTMLMGDSESTGITELTGMVPVRNEKSDMDSSTPGRTIL